MIPYPDFGPLKLGPLEIHAFGVLVAIGILLGSWVTIRHARKRGLDLDLLRSAITWLLVAGFVCAHFMALFAYEPERVVREPWSILMFWSGLASYGGFIGAFLGLYLYTRRRKVAFGPYADVVALGLIPGWFFGRLGCYTAHDHMGRATDFFLAVKYPASSKCIQMAGGKFSACHDLGFYEVLLMIAFFGIFEWLRRLDLRPGRIAALLGLLYAPVRFGFDFLRILDVRYGGLTPGQYASILVFGLCVYALTRPPSDLPVVPAQAPKPSRKKARAR